MTEELVNLQIVRDARSGDAHAREALVMQLLPRVRNAVAKLLAGANNEAADIVGACMVEILAGLRSYRADGPIEAWADRLTFRVAMRHLKRLRRRERTIQLDPKVSGKEEEGGIETLSRARLARQLDAHLARLPSVQREALVLRLVFGHSVEEVAEVTDVPINTVRGRIRLGLSRLRRSLNRDPELSSMLAEVARGK